MGMDLTTERLDDLYDRPYTASQAEVRALLAEVRRCRRIEDAAAEIVRHVTGPAVQRTTWYEAKRELIAAVALPSALAAKGEA